MKKHRWTEPRPDRSKKQKQVQEQPKESQGTRTDLGQHVAGSSKDQPRKPAAERGLTKAERAAIRDASRASLVRTPEEQEYRRTGMDRKLQQLHTDPPPWMSPEDVA
jgi:hypothetical protein